MGSLNEEYKRLVADGVPEAEAKQWLESQGVDSAETETNWGAIARSALGQGLAFGFGDELEAMWDAKALPGSPEYTQRRDEIRGELNQWRNDNPGTALTTELIGGLAGGGPLAAGGKWLGKQVLKRTLPSVTGAIGFGAAEGALVGAGQAEELENVPAGMATGGAIGGIGSGAMVGLGRMVDPVSARAGGNQVIADSLQNAGIRNADEAMSEMNRVAGPGGVIADIPGMGQTFRGAAFSAPGARNTAEAFMEPRLSNMPDQMMRTGRSVIGDSLTPIQRVAQISDDKMSDALINYGAAMRMPVVPDEQVLSIFNSSLGRRAYHKAFDDFNSMPEHRLNPMAKVDIDDADTIQDLGFWDLVRRRIGSAEKVAHRQGNSSDVRAAIDMKSAIMDPLNKQTDGAYDFAVSEFHKASKAQDAVDFGGKLLTDKKLRPADVADRVANMTDWERKETLRGVISQLIATAEEGVDGANAARNAIKKPAVVRKIMNVFDNNREGAAFIQNLQHLTRQGSTAQNLLSGSRTAIIQSEKENLGGLVGTIGGGAVTGDPMGAVLGSVLGTAKQRLKKVNPKKMEHITKQLLLGGTKAEKALAEIFTKQMEPSILAPAAASSIYNAVSQ